MQKLALLLLLACCLSACTFSRPMTLPDGSRGQMITCHGSLNSMSNCMVKAGEICPGGYDVLNGDQESQPFMASTGGFSATRNYASGSYGTYGGTIAHRSLMVRCHNAPVAPATATTIQPSVAPAPAVKSDAPSLGVPPPGTHNSDTVKY
jgi:hypothetical protein